MMVAFITEAASLLRVFSPPRADVSVLRWACYEVPGCGKGKTTPPQDVSLYENVETL